MRKNHLLILGLFLFCFFAASVKADINVSLISPVTNTYSNGQLNATFNVTDFGGGTIQNCSIWTNVTGTWGRTVTNSTQNVVGNMSLSWINYSFSTDGNYLFNVECYENNGVGNFSVSNRTFIKDATSPDIGSWASNSNLSNTGTRWHPSLTLFFNLSMTDANENRTEVNITNSTHALYAASTNAADYYNFTYTLPREANYTVNITMYDQAGNSNLTSITVVADTTFPTMANSTGNQANDTIRDTINWIYYNISQSDTYYANTTFYLYYWNGTVANSTSYTASTTTSINWTGLAYGTYTYKAKVMDKAGNSNTSSIFTQRLFTTESTFNSTKSTNFSAVTNWSRVAVTLASNAINVTWTNNQDLSAAPLDFSTYVTIATESVYVDSATLGLSGEATITMSGLSYANTPEIRKDGAACSSCQSVSYSSGTLKFKTTGFSTYTLRSNDGSGGVAANGGGGGVGGTVQGYCGNGICDKTYIGETIDNCPQDCQEVYDRQNVYQVGVGSVDLNQRHTPSLDSDSDGLTDIQETSIFYTNPQKKDSDNDGVNDNVEAAQGTTPGKVKTSEAPSERVNQEEPDKAWLPWTIYSIGGLAIVGSLLFIFIKKKKNPYT